MGAGKIAAKISGDAALFLCKFLDIPVDEEGDDGADDYHDAENVEFPA